MINKNIQIWRGFDTPPTNYHLWLKEDSLYKYNGEEWIPISSSGGGSGIIAVESLADLPEDAEIGSLASVNHQYTKEYNIVDKFTLSDSRIANTNPVPIKHWIPKNKINWPSNVSCDLVLVGLSLSAFCEILLSYWFEDGYPYLEAGFLIYTPFASAENLVSLLLENEEGQIVIVPNAYMLLGTCFNSFDMFTIGVTTWDDELGDVVFRDLNTDELEFFGLFFNYDKSYSYTKNIDVNDLLIKEFKGWRLRNDVEIVQSEEELNPEAPAGSIASVITDNYEEKWVKPSELVSLEALTSLGGMLPINLAADSEINSDLIGDVVNDILEELLKILSNLSPIKQISINVPWTYVNLVPQELRKGRDINIALIPKYLNMQNMEPPMLYLYADDYEFGLYWSNGGTLIETNYDTGELIVYEDLIGYLNTFLAAETCYWGGCSYRDDEGNTISLTHIIDLFITVKTCSGESKTDFHIKNKDLWKQLASSKLENLFVNSEGIKFKGYVNVDNIKGVNALYDSLNVNEVAFAVPSTSLIGTIDGDGMGLPLISDSYVPWALTGLREGAIELSPELFTVGLVLGGKTGFELRTYFMLDQENPYLQCPDMLLLAKVEVNLKELILPLLQAELGVDLNIPETIIVSVGKILRFGGGSSGGGSLKTLDNSIYLDDYTQTGVVPYKQASGQLPTNDYFTIFIQCPKDTDHNNYYHVQQTAYGRTGGASGRVWTRLCLVNDVSGNYETFPWREAGSDASELSSINSSISSLNSNLSSLSSNLTSHISKATANIPSLTHTKYSYGYDMDKAVNTGIIHYTTVCTKGVPGGLNSEGKPENYTVIVFGSSDEDGNNYRTIWQIAYGRTGHVNERVWTRVMFKHNSSTSKDDFYPWVEITNRSVESDIDNIYNTVIPGLESDIANLAQGSLTSGSVTADKLGDDVKAMIANAGVPLANSSDSLPTDAVTGSFASIVTNGKTTLWVKNDTGWQEYGKESDPEEITNITDIL